MNANISHIDGNAVLPRLNAVRFFVVLMIALGYASTMPIGPENMETAQIFGYEPSWLGIQILFLLSGALAYRSLSSGRTGWTYLRSRILRVFPMLLAMTLTTVFVIYPILGKPLEGPQNYIDLAKYFFLTVTVIDPGRPLPGLLDDAVYMCLIQGAIWTLRWGLILHIGVAALGHMKSITAPRVLLFGSVIATLIYAAVYYAAAKTQIEALRMPLTGIRFGYIFLIGMTLWAYRNALPRGLLTRVLIASGLFALAAVNYVFLHWTPLIEISLTLCFGYSAWLAATSQTSRLSVLSGWPHLAAGLLMINWPTAQVFLHIYPELGRWTLPLISLPVSIGLTLLTYWALTGRINTWVARRLVRKVAVETARP